MSDQIIADYNPHPGEHIRDEMNELGMSQAELARALGIPRTRVSEILRGRRGITADTAVRLARWLDTSPQMWLNLQAIHDLRKVEDEAGDAIRAGHAASSRRVGSRWPRSPGAALPPNKPVISTGVLAGHGAEK